MTEDRIVYKGVIMCYDDDNKCLHNTNGPAYEGPKGEKEWWVNGKKHRIDGPAIEGRNGHKEWWQNGALHRLDGPAVERAGGTKIWYQNGLLHRVDGPAIEYDGGYKEWWIKDERLNSEEEWFEALEEKERMAYLFKLEQQWQPSEEL